MWVIGAGIAMGGLVSLAFAPVLWCIIAILGGIFIATVTDWRTLQKESRHNEWRRAYPTYKY